MRKSLKKIVAIITALSIIVVSLVSAFATDDNKTELMFVDGSSCEHIQCTWAINVPSSCTTDGEENKICITCYTVVDTKVIPASGHDDGVWTVSLQATCINDGEEELACTACGEVFETKAIPATGHDQGIWKIDFEPTIEHDGQMSRYCSKCDVVLESKPFSSHNHAEGHREVIVPATCTVDGTGGIFCELCGAKFDSYVIPALEHIYSDWYMNGDSTHSRTCSRCHYEERNSCVFTSETCSPTCTEDGYAEHVCDVCTYTVYEHYAPLGHDWSEWIDDSNGESHTSHCEREGCDATETKIHDWSEWIYKEQEVDCLSYEYTFMSRCHDCGAIQKEVIEGDLCCPLLIIFGGTTIGITIATIIAAWNAAITAASIVGGVSAVFIFFKFIFPELQKIHTVTYKVNGEIYRFFLAKEGGPVPVPKDPEVAGQEFNGWEPEVPEVMPDHDLVFEADMEDAEETVEEETVETVIPETGSAMSGTAAITVTAGLALAVLALLRKKKES